MKLKKLLVVACAVVVAGAILVSCTQSVAVNLPEFVKVDASEEEIQVDGNQRYMAYEIDFVSDKEYETPVYTVLRVIGPQHQPFYEMEVKLHGFVALGSGPSRKAAQMDAAKKLYLHLTKK